MQDTETVSDTNCCQIVSIAEFGSRKKDQIERWIEKRMLEEYGEKDEVTVKNPLLRLSVMFGALSDASQLELYGYAKRAALDRQGGWSMEREFWNFLEAAPAAWEDIEEFADKLLIREKICVQMEGAYCKGGNAE